MNPLTQKIIGSVVRAILMVLPLSVKLTDSEIEKYVDAVIIVGTVVWSVYQKVRSQRVTNTAIASPNARTLEEVVQIVEKTGGASAMLPADAVPVIPNNKDGR